MCGGVQGPLRQQKGGAGSACASPPMQKEENTLQQEKMRESLVETEAAATAAPQRSTQKSTLSLSLSLSPVCGTSHQSHCEADGEDGGNWSRRRPGGDALLLQRQDGQPGPGAALHQGGLTDLLTDQHRGREAVTV